MTATPFVPAIRLALVFVSLALATDAALLAQSATSSSPQVRRQTRCFSDAGTVRACLVPQAQLEGRPNIRIGQSECYWLREDEKEKRKQYKRSANGRPRQFAFQVINLCAAPVTVRFDLEVAVEGDLRFLTPQCEKNDKALELVRQEGRLQRPPRTYLEIPLGPIAAGDQKGATCDTLPYKGKICFGKSLRRTFQLVATHYAGTALEKPILFDPEVVLEKAGHP